MKYPPDHLIRWIYFFTGADELQGRKLAVGFSPLRDRSCKESPEDSDSAQSQAMALGGDTPNKSSSYFAYFCGLCH